MHGTNLQIGVAHPLVAGVGVCVVHVGSTSWLMLWCHQDETFAMVEPRWEC
jgi:hypothetical protein